MAVREGLLLLLAERPRHGYELRSLFEQRTGELWPLNTGQVYTTLDRLERDGLVEPVADAGSVGGSGGAVGTGRGSGDGRRRSYRLTEAGREETRAWLAAPVGDGAPRDELVMKVLLVATSGDREAALATIDGHRHELLARLQQLRRAQREEEAPTLGARLMADALAVRAEADLRWLDLCVERLAARAAATNADDPDAGDGAGGGARRRGPARRMR
ncbi:MAG TPA: PadR family transcriptional regulator [Acidimicrobiales bacterium]